MRLLKATTVRKPVAGAVGIAAAVCALSACGPLPSTADKDYHGKVSGSGEPPSSISAPAAPAYPVTITGTGESVETAELVPHGYTVKYQAASNCIIVKPVQSDGTDGSSFVNQCASGGSVSGTTTYRATGRTTFHVFNTNGAWTLTFNPL